MADDIVVREVDFRRPEDCAAYLAMLDAYARDAMGIGRSLPDTVHNRLIEDLTDHPTARCLIAERDNEPVGFATCFVGYSTFQARPLLNIHDIAVVPGARRQGVAQALLEKISGIGQQLGCCRLTLEVRDDNTAARQLYAQVGFAAATCSLFMEKPL